VGILVSPAGPQGSAGLVFKGCIAHPSFWRTRWDEPSTTCASAPINAFLGGDERQLPWGEFCQVIVDLGEEPSDGIEDDLTYRVEDEVENDSSTVKAYREILTPAKK
jgi:hypothetical protein